MAVGVPDIALDFGFLHCGREPCPHRDLFIFGRPHPVTWLMLFGAQPLEDVLGINVQMYRPGRPVLGLRQLDGAAIQMNLAPGQCELLGQTHAGVDGNDELIQMLRVVFGNDLTKCPTKCVFQGMDAAI